MKYKELVDEGRSFTDKVNEELLLHGFVSKVVPNSRKIEIQTIAGVVSFELSIKPVNYMSEFYRAVHHIGCKLSSWGLENKIKEQGDE